MISWLKKIPAFVVFLTSSIIYLIIGYLLGYYHGYTSGQNDYFNYLNNLTK